MTQHEQNAPLDQQATIHRLERLSHDQAHLRQAALQLAGSLLQDCGEDVMQLLIGE